MVLHVENSLCLSARSAEMTHASHCIFDLIEIACKLLIAHIFFFLSIFFFSDSLGFPKFFVEQN